MREALSRIANCKGFEWDPGNRLKNSVQHGVECAEAEEVFFNVSSGVKTAQTYQFENPSVSGYETTEE